MAVETITVGTLASKVSAIVCGTPTVPANFATSIKQALHGALREMVRDCEAWLQSEATIAVVAGTSDYDLPDDFHRMIDPGVWMPTDPYRVLEFADMQQYVGEMWFKNTAQAEPQNYLFQKADATTGKLTLRLYPIPLTNRNITIRYVAVPANISAAADGVYLDARIPPAFHDVLVSGAVVKYAMSRLIDERSLSLCKSDWENGKARARAQQVRVMGVARQRRRYDDVRRSGYVPPAVGGQSF